MTRIVLLGSASSIHIARLANAIAKRGHVVCVISLHPLEHLIVDDVDVFVIPRSLFVNYITAAFRVLRLVRKFQPDILNAHYASGYGLLASLVPFTCKFLSVWGSDVYAFPFRSIFHKAMLSWSLRSAHAIGSTSHCMARQTALFCSTRPIFVTPFGIDTEQFCPIGRSDEDSDRLVIGTVKSLNPVYGIDLLIRAFHHAWTALDKPNSLFLEITGDGPDRAVLSALANDLGIAAQVTFHGRVAHHHIPDMLNRLDVFVALSRAESFGVAILEASACGLPVVVSDADGLTEVTLNGVTGLVVPREDYKQAGKAIVKLLADRDLRHHMGRRGREHVVAQYASEPTTDTFLDALHTTIKDTHNG